MDANLNRLLALLDGPRSNHRPGCCCTECMEPRFSMAEAMAAMVAASVEDRPGHARIPRLVGSGHTPAAAPDTQEG